MTEHESEQFYQDLKRKLEGYGSAPPESVWAGIREQVPARRPRNRRPLLLLLLLAFVVGTVKIGADYWHPFQATSPGIIAAGRQAAGPATGRSASQSGGPASTLAGPTGLAAGSASPAGPAATSSSLSPNSAAEANGDANDQLTIATARRNPAADGLPGVAAGATRKPRPRLLVSGRETTRSNTTRRKRRATALLALAGRNGRPFRTSPETTGRNAPRPSFGRRSRADQQLATQSAPPAPGAETLATATTADRRRNRSKSPKISNEPLALLAVRPPALEPAAPEVHAKRRARQRPTKQELRLRNWSAQLLLGSGLTYRFLGGAPTQLERLERPGLGFSGQATAGYAFSRQLTVTAGLGYAEFANSLNYKLKKDSLEGLQQQNFRDVYRFLTIPVQAQLTLQGNHRWRYGVLGGGTVAVLTGARTTEGSACNCRQQQWTTDAVNLPFRRVSLAVTGGVFASYQLQPGQWLTVQPQAQVFLNSLTLEGSTRAPRRPWSTGVQLGYSWDLDPRKH